MRVKPGQAASRKVCHRGFCDGASTLDSTSQRTSLALQSTTPRTSSMQPTTSTASSSKSAPSNNQSAVAALLRSRLNSGVAPTDVYSPQYVPLRGTYQPAARTAPKPQHAAPVASSSTTPPPGCPMHVDGASQSTPSALPSKPPSSSPWSSTLNPLNYMPSLSQSRAEKQETELPTERVRSSIPRAPTSPGRGASPYDAPSSCPVAHAADAKAAPTDAEGENWEYPSAQQFYNALVRKGWETPEEHVEMMVLVHNFLNERAWTEVLEWERDMGSEPSKVSLAKFQGRPGTLSPKARIFGWLGVIAPSKFK